MAKTFSQKMKELRRVAKLHANWLIYATLGESAVTKEELEELTKYGKLPMGSSLDLVDKSYLLGRLKAILKTSEYKKVSYEEASEKAEGMKLSPLEELVIEQARLKAGTYLKNLSTEINNGVYDALSQAIGKAVSEASVSDAVADEVALAAIYKKTAQQLASDLASRLQTGAKKNWTAVAKTELQRAKIAGHAQAIVNKIDIYQNSDGANSDVSIIPAKECCGDCREHYLDAKGNPKVFKLADLMSAGSNADDGVSHSKRNGKHIHWKTTLPPLHPNCGCQLFYIPPGYGWSSGKLELLNKSLFAESMLRKAHAGVRSKEMSATVKPQGAPQPPKPPGGESGGGTGGRPPAGGGLAAPAGSGGGDDLAPCPFGGGKECSNHGGDGAQNHKVGGEVFQAHQAAIAEGAKPVKPESQQQTKEQSEQQSKQYDAKPHPVAVIAGHLEDGKIASAKLLGKEEGGVHSSYKVQIEGNGNGCMKPPPKFRDETYEGFAYADGAGSIPKNSGHLSEKAAYNVATWLGMDDHVPVTVVRDHDGSSGVPYEGEMSVQHWQDDCVPLSRMKREDIHTYKDLIDAAPAEHKEKLKKKLQEVACLDFIINNNDRHLDNLVYKPDFSDFRAIDHGLAFGSGLAGHKNGIQRSMLESNENLSVPDHLFTRLKAQSFAQTKRQLEDTGLKDWQIAHTHLRMKYLTHLQENHGQIPIETTRYALPRAITSDPTLAATLKNMDAPTYLVPESPGWEGNAGDRMSDAEVLHARFEMPDQLFARFAKDYISGNLNSDLTEDEKSELSKSMILFPAGTGYRDGGTLEERKEYWNSIPAWKPNRNWPKAEMRIEPVRTPAETPKSVESSLSTSRSAEDQKMESRAGTPASLRRQREKEKQAAAKYAEAEGSSSKEVDPFGRTVSAGVASHFEAGRTHVDPARETELSESDLELLSDDEDAEPLSEADIEPLDENDKVKKSLYLYNYSSPFPLDSLRWE